MPRKIREHLRARDRGGLPFGAFAFWLGLVTLIGCGSPVPGPEQAAKAILATRAFSIARTVRIPAVHSGTCSAAIQTEPEWGRWIELGLATVRPVMSSSGITCRLVLDEAMVREAKLWDDRVEDSGEDGAVLVVPVAVRNLIRVTEIRKIDAGLAEVVFDWQWRFNQAGQRLGMDSQVKTGRAELVLDEGAWRALRLDVGAD
jgi:hypothetical protein